MRLLPVLLLFGLSGPLFAATLHVDDVGGNDTNPGTSDQPLKTIARAVALARPGDEIRLAPHPHPLHERLLITGRSGEPDKPIVFDGGGRTLIGTRPIDPEEWEEVRPGVYRSTTYLKERLEKEKNPGSFFSRWFLVINGEVQRMGLFDKLRRPALPAPGELAPGQWTFSQEEKAFYFALKPGQTLEEARVEVPHLENGVALRGNVAHWIIRNLHVRRVINDGFNFHGACHHILLENISATECSDDGMSAHGECRITVRNFTAERNATGICHIDASCSENDQVTLKNNIGPNLYLLGTGTHTFANSRISALGQGVRIGTKKKNTEDTSEVSVRFVNTTIEDKDAAGARYQVQETGRVIEP